MFFFLACGPAALAEIIFVGILDPHRHKKQYKTSMCFPIQPTHLRINSYAIGVLGQKVLPRVYYACIRRKPIHRCASLRLEYAIWADGVPGGHNKVGNNRADPINITARWMGHMVWDFVCCAGSYIYRFLRDIGSENSS